MSCQDGCYPVNIASCEDEIIVTGLEANQPYYYLLINKYQKIYQRLVTTDGQGKLIIDTTILPPGSMNKFSGPFRLEFRNGTNYTTKILFSFDGISYSCIEINLLDIDIAADATDFSNIITLNITAPPPPDATYIEDVVEGEGISIDKTDPKKPVISASGGLSSDELAFVQQLKADYES